MKVLPPAEPTYWRYYPKPHLENQRLGPVNRDSECNIVIPESFRRRDSLMRPRVNPIVWAMIAAAAWTALIALLIKSGWWLGR